MSSMLAAFKNFLNPTGWWTGLTPPKFYSYAPDTGEYMGGGDCDPSQLEEGVWLYPGYSTPAAPPPVGDGRVCVWDGDVWLDCHDRRGELVYVDGEFRAITTIGQHDDLKLEVHDAQYVLPNNDTQIARIRMWVNDDVIEFDDLPELPARIVLAAWELQGETIRPIDADIETVEERDARRAAAEAEADRLAQLAAEGRNEETDNVQ